MEKEREREKGDNETIHVVCNNKLAKCEYSTKRLEAKEEKVEKLFKGLYKQPWIINMQTKELVDKLAAFEAHLDDDSLDKANRNKIMEKYEAVSEEIAIRKEQIKQCLTNLRKLSNIAETELGIT
ncbi:hypothetical protein KI387_037121, partial [Taxus chinensis]